MEQINVYKDEFQRMRKSLTQNIFKPDIVPHQMPKQKMQPALKKAVQNGQNNRAGGLIGAILTGAIGFNAGKYSRLGAIRKRSNFLRKLVTVSKKPGDIIFTNYFYPNLNIVTKNFICFSGQSGIGKSYHFENMSYLQSLIRPSLYLSFKASGKGTTFEQDVSIKLNYGDGQNPPMLSQIMLAVRKIHQINTKPYKLWINTFLTHIGFIWSANGIIESHMLDANQGLFLGMLGTAYCYYFYMLYPLLIQSFRRTKPLLIFDDVNKIDDIGKLAQISRYLQLMDRNMSNVILVSSDQQTWFKLRKQPGLKDRLRQRIISYDNKFTSQQMLLKLQNQSQFKSFLNNQRISPLYTKQLIKLLIKQLIGNRQVTISRLNSILILNDQQQYQRFVNVLIAVRQNRMTHQQAVIKITDSKYLINLVLYQSQMQTICAKLKHIKRQLKISQQQYVEQMAILLQKGKLPSDNKIGPHLMIYNIVRDFKSQYVFNGKFKYTVFQMAFQQYVKDLKTFIKNQNLLNLKVKDYNCEIASRAQQIKKNVQQK